MGIESRELNALAAEIATDLKIPGAQIAVLHRGEPVEGAAGVANVETGVAVTPDTLFQIGSTTKLHTAVLLMQLVDSGRVDLDAPVADQLPNFSLPDADALRALTPRHLMSMSSGLDNGPYTDFGRGDDALARYVEGLAALPMSFRPGQGFGYSNASTNVSGRLIEHATGETWEKALEARLLKPSNLHHSAAFAEDVIHRRFAVGHRLDDAEVPVSLERWSYPRSMGPAGGTLCSTAGDLVRFANLFLHDGMPLAGERVLSPDAVNAMQDRQVALPQTLLAEWWGLGPYGNRWGGVDVLGHSGTNIGGSSYLLWARGRDLAVATTVNLPQFGYPFAKRAFRDLFQQLGDIILPGPPDIPPIVRVDGDRFVGRYAMTGITFTVSADGDDLMISSHNELKPTDSVPPSPLIPLSPTTFLPTHPGIDGRRGWALAFVGPKEEPATHLINGFFALRRIAD